MLSHHCTLLPTSPQVIFTFDFFINTSNQLLYIVNKIAVLRDLLKVHKISDPTNSILYKIATYPYILDDACSSSERAIDIYREFQALPKTFTVALIVGEFGLTVNGPKYGDNPFVLTATDMKTGHLKIVKMLRLSSQSLLPLEARTFELKMEIQACEILSLANPSHAFVNAIMMSYEINESHASFLGMGISRDLRVLIMPEYPRSLTTTSKIPCDGLASEGRRILDALKFMHTVPFTFDNKEHTGLVHMDVKNSNILLDINGHWVLADFGSCKPIGYPITSSTPFYYHKPLRYSAINPILAHPRYDYYMFLVTLLIETLPDKHKLEDLVEVGAQRVSDAKIVAMMASHKNSDLGLLLSELYELATMM
jgi:hypothetical protein